MFDIITMVSGEDKERLKNFNTWYAYMKMHLPNSNIIVVEQNTNNDFSKYDVNHVRIETQNKLFNRGLNINTGVLASDSSYCYVTDSDILIDSKCIEFLSKNYQKSNFIIPYNYCMDLSKEETERVNIILPYGGTVRCKDNANLNYGKNETKGGCIFFNKRAFLEVGGYHEGCWGWGAEDDIFFYTLERLGIKILRPNDHHKIYHLYHKPSGPASLEEREKNLDLYKNTEIMYNICSMENDVFLEYLKDNRRILLRG